MAPWIQRNPHNQAIYKHSGGTADSPSSNMPQDNSAGLKTKYVSTLQIRLCIKVVVSLPYRKSLRGSQEHRYNDVSTSAGLEAADAASRRPAFGRINFGRSYSTLSCVASGRQETTSPSSGAAPRPSARVTLSPRI